MTKRLSIVFSSVLIMVAALPAAAEDDPLTREQLLSHPEVAGAIATIDAYVQGVQRYDKVPGISAGIPAAVSDSCLQRHNGRSSTGAIF